jgi:hypothetical protein
VGSSNNSEGMGSSGSADCCRSVHMALCVVAGAVFVARLYSFLGLMSLDSRLVGGPVTELQILGVSFWFLSRGT